MMRGRTAAAQPRVAPGVPPNRRPIARMASQIATSATSAPPFFTFALALYASVVVGRLHEVVPVLARFYLGKLSALLLLGAFVMESSQIPYRAAFKSKTAKCIGAVTLLGILSVPTSYWPGQSAGFLENSWPLIALLGIGVLTGLSNRITARRTLAVLTLVAALAAAELVAGGGMIQSMSMSNNVNGAISQRSYIGGGGSTTYDSNYSAAFFVMMIPYALMFASRKGPLRWIAMVAVPILGVGMIKTGSRGGIVALAVLAICIVVFSDKKDRPKQIAILAIGAAAMMLAPHSDLTARMRSLFTGEDYNFDAKGGRWEVWSNGMTMLLHRPILGVGMYAFPVADHELGSGYMDAHNSYVQIAAELGIPGIVVFVMMIGAAFKAVIGMRKSSLAAVRSGHGGEDASFDLALSTAALFSLIAELTAAAFLSLAYESMTIFALSVPVGIALMRSPARQGAVAAARKEAPRLRGMRPRRVPPQPTGSPRPAS